MTLRSSIFNLDTLQSFQSSQMHRHLNLESTISQKHAVVRFPSNSNCLRSPPYNHSNILFGLADSRSANMMRYLPSHRRICRLNVPAMQYCSDRVKNHSFSDNSSFANGNPCPVRTQRPLIDFGIISLANQKPLRFK